MALLKRMLALRLVAAVGIGLIAVVAQMSMPGLVSADDRDDNEVVIYGPNACTTIPDLPIYQPATCIKHKSEFDDGVTEKKNSYITQASADAVRRAFEASFQQNGWTVLKADQDLEDQEWDYTIVKDLRRIKVEIEAQEPDEGIGTEFSTTEK